MRKNIVIVIGTEAPRRVMPPSPKIVQLRQQLSERFPGVRFHAEPSADVPQGWATGLQQIDSLLHGGLPKGAITEIVAAKTGTGGALLVASLLRKIAEGKQILALIDGQDSFDPAAFGNEALSRLLWIRCRNAEQALKAADLVVRDRNVPFAILDLQLNPATQLRKIPSSTWYRLQRILEAGSTVFVVLTPQAMVGCAQVRLNLQSRFSFEALEKNESELLGKLKVELSQHRLHISQPEERIAHAG